MNKRHDRNYLEIMYGKENMPDVNDETRLCEDLHFDAKTVRLLTAYIKTKYAKTSQLQPEFQTIGDIDNYIFYEFYCAQHKYL